MKIFDYDYTDVRLPVDTFINERDRIEDWINEFIKDGCSAFLIPKKIPAPVDPFEGVKQIYSWKLDPELQRRYEETGEIAELSDMVYVLDRRYEDDRFNEWRNMSIQAVFLFTNANEAMRFQLQFKGL